MIIIRFLVEIRLFQREESRNANQSFFVHIFAIDLTVSESIVLSYDQMKEDKTCTYKCVITGKVEKNP